MLPKTRSSNTTVNEAGTGPTGKQTPAAIMGDKGNEPATDPQFPKEESDHKLLLNILANQKASDDQQETS